MKIWKESYLFWVRASPGEKSRTYCVFDKIRFMTDTPKIVRDIISDVRKRGDVSLCDLAMKFDRSKLLPNRIVVSKQEIANARKYVSDTYLRSIKKCAKNIEIFALHELKQIAKSWKVKRGPIQIGQLIRPVDSVGLYIPGG